MSGFANHPYAYGKYQRDELDSYAKAVVKLGKRDSKKVANNTYIRRTGLDTIALRLHETDILVWHEDGSVELNSGGWQTVTTKSRMNEFAPGGWYDRSGDGQWRGFRISVWTQCGTWYVTIHTLDGRSRTVHFMDHMHINVDGHAVRTGNVGWSAREWLVLHDADPEADLRAYRREKAREGRERRRREEERRAAYVPPPPLSPEEQARHEEEQMRMQVMDELEERDRAWRAAQTRALTQDPTDESKVYVPEFARGNGKA